MAKKKAELEQDVAAYEAHLARAEESLRYQNFDDALTHAVAAWDYVDGMMQYKRRYAEQQFSSIRCVDIVTTYAPMLFRSDVLEQLGMLLSSQRRVEKNTKADLGHALATARRRLADAHRLWNLVAHSTEARLTELSEHLGGDQGEWERIARLSCEIGVFCQVSIGDNAPTLGLVTRLDATCRGKCPACGAVAVGQKMQLLEMRTCELCEARGLFCLIPEGEL